MGDGFRLLSLILLLEEISAGLSTKPPLFIGNDETGDDGIGSTFVAAFRPRERGFGFGLTGCCCCAIRLLLLLLLPLLLLPYNDCEPPPMEPMLPLPPYPSMSGVGFVILLNVALNALLLSSIEEAVFSK